MIHFISCRKTLKKGTITVEEQETFKIMRENKREGRNRSRVASEWEDRHVEDYFSCTNDSCGNYSTCNRRPRRFDLFHTRSVLDREVQRIDLTRWSSMWNSIDGCIRRPVESGVSSRRPWRNFDPLRFYRSESDEWNRTPSVRWTVEDPHQTNRNKDRSHRWWNTSREFGTTSPDCNRENDAMRSDLSKEESFESVAADGDGLFGPVSPGESTPWLSAGLVVDVVLLLVERGSEGSLGHRGFSAVRRGTDRFWKIE